MPVQFFFEDVPDDISNSEHETAGFSEEGGTGAIMDFLNSPEGFQLSRAFSQIPDPIVRRRVVDLVKALAGADSEE